MIAESPATTTSSSGRAEAGADSSSALDRFVLPALPGNFLDRPDDYSIRVIEILWRTEARKKLLRAMSVDPSTSSSSFEFEDTSCSSVFPSRIFEFIKTVGDWYVDLRNALCDLDEAATEARDEDFPVPSDLAMTNARRLLLAMYELLPQRFEVYPTPDGEVAIGAPGGHGCSVLLLCDSDGGALCLVNRDGRHRRARYSDTGSLPDGFVREALEGLARRDELAACR